MANNKCRQCGHWFVPTKSPEKKYCYECSGNRNEKDRWYVRWKMKGNHPGKGSNAGMTRAEALAFNLYKSLADHPRKVAKIRRILDLAESIKFALPEGAVIIDNGITARVVFASQVPDILRDGLPLFVVSRI